MLMLCCRLRTQGNFNLYFLTAAENGEGHHLTRLGVIEEIRNQVFEASNRLAINTGNNVATDRVAVGVRGAGNQFGVRCGTIRNYGSYQNTLLTLLETK